MTGCTTTANMATVQNGAFVRVKNSVSSERPPVTSTPRQEVFTASTFGKYEFKAEHASFEPLYGMLPRKFNGGYLALDILFFTPAMFFNLSEVYPYYEFDLDKRVVRYRRSLTDGWTVYEPSVEEMNRAKEYFKDTPDTVVREKAVAKELSASSAASNNTPAAAK
jgi:hypothetical protein